MTLAVRQGSPEWLAARRALVTATDIPVLLGLSAYKSEAQLADEKRGEYEQPTNVRMRIGSAVQPLIGALYTEATGNVLRAWRGLATHREIEWAGASPDFRTAKGRRLVEAKRMAASRLANSTGEITDSTGRHRLPQDVEAQIAWQLGVTGYPVADAAVLVADDELLTFEVPFDRATFDNLVTLAADFRRRLADGGPFAHNAASLKARYPADNGAELIADEALTAAALELARTRVTRKEIEAREEALETAIKTRMADFASVRGPGWRATWKRTKDGEQTDWRSLADGLLRQLPEPERTALVGLDSSVRPGFRPFRLVVDGGEE